jgi:hypothetical protein
MSMIKKEMSVAEYYEQIANAQAKIAELQAKCNHLEYEVAFYMWRPGSMFPARICKTCNFCIKEADHTESEKLWAEYNETLKANVADLLDSKKETK